MTIVFIILCAIPIGFITWRLFFLRDPKRTVPKTKVIVAPADGYIAYIKTINSNAIVSTKKTATIDWSHVPNISNDLNGILIGIFMPPTAVHRNRIPFDGTITGIYHYQSKQNLSLLNLLNKFIFKRKIVSSDLEHVAANEKCTLELSTKLGVFYITQIAGKDINRIVLWINKNQKVLKGEQYGMIRFGSQCDIFIPDSSLNSKLLVKEGDYLYAGESIIAKSKS